MDTVNLIIGSIVLQLSNEPGMLAEVVFDNKLGNNYKEEQVYILKNEEINLEVSLQFGYNVNETAADSITVDPPDGILCIPASCVLEVEEDFTGTLYLYEFVGV